jgi:hypothetical protein
MKKRLFSIVFVFTALLSMSQEELKTIKGKVTYLDVPLVNAKVSISNSDEIINTSLAGNYEIEALPGQVISYSYKSMRTMQIVV